MPVYFQEYFPISSTNDTAPSSQLRRTLRKRRAALPRQTRKLATQDALHNLAKTQAFRRARKVALYYPVGGELNVLAHLQSSAFSAKIIYLPVIVPGRVNTLKFAEMHAANHWRKNRFGIAEPRLRNGALLRAARLDLVVAPLLGFNASCARLGAGGGFYDRTFSAKKRGASWRKPRLVGIAFECQRLDQLTPQPWDVAMDAIVTEKKIYSR